MVLFFSLVVIYELLLLKKIKKIPLKKVFFILSCFFGINKKFIFF
ncbi:hypothetical Protein psc1_06310 [Candidatus Phytoplasma solani]